jgi:hypothetical protein
MSGSTSRLLAGIVSFTIDGAPWNAVDAVEYTPTMVTRETLKGQSAVEGFSEMPQQGRIAAQLRDRADATVQSLNAVTNSTIVIQAANGKTVTGSGMWQVGDIRVGTKEGTFSIEFESDIVTEQTA